MRPEPTETENPVPSPRKGGTGLRLENAVMLMKTQQVIYQEPQTPQESARHVTGQYLPKNRLNARDRARLAVGIIDERVKIRNLTVGQVARLCRVSVPYVIDARRPPAKPESLLAEHFARATPAEWLEATRAVGPAAVWDRMIAPLV
jgi:hypothetical protein